MLKILKKIWIIRFLGRKIRQLLQKIFLLIINQPLLRALYRVTNQYKKILDNVFQRKLPCFHTCKQENTTYLFYYEYATAGVDHLKYNLKFYLLEACELNRTCVLTNPGLYSLHNNGIEVNEPWSKYIDFEKSTFPKKINYIFYSEFLKKEFSKKEILVVHKNYKIKSEENKKYRVIIRNVRCHGSLFQIAQARPVLFHPAKRIIDEAKIVLDQISEEFCAVHIRRGDMLKYIDGLVADLLPQNVMKKLKEYNPQKLPIFLMTNEPNKNYYDNLSQEFKVHCYYDFDNLMKVAMEKDNYLLYEIEKLIFLEAKIKIETFKNTWTNYSLSDINRDFSRWCDYVPTGLFKAFD